MRLARRWRAALFCGVQFIAFSPVAAQKPLGTARSALPKGVVGLSFGNLQTGDTLFIRGDEPFPTVSGIKLPLLVELFHQTHR